MKKIIITISILTIWLGLIAQEVSETKFKPSGKVFGKVYLDFFYKAEGDTILEGVGQYQKTEKDFYAFSMRRFYLGYEYNFSPKFSAKLMLEGNDGQLIGGSKRGVNIKTAQLKWKNIFPGSNLIIGAQSTPTWSLFTEKQWGYRSIEKTIMDFRKVGISNDLGISLQGSFNKSKTIGYNLMFGNGSAQKPEFNKYKKYMGSVNAKLFNEMLLFEIYADYEQAPDNKSITTIKGFLGFQTPRITIGLEAFQQIQKNYKSTDHDYSIFGATLFIKGAIIPDKFNAYIRADIFNPEYKDVALGYNEMFAVVGFDYIPFKNIHIMPNLWYNYYSRKTASIPHRINDIVPRITLYYKF